MTQLYINGHLCDLPTDFKITLVTENLYFSKASTYTYDIQLPIAPFSNNAKIFGNINRTDKRIESTTLPAQLIVDNKVIVNGVAVIVGTSDNSVSVQLMQGNSQLNWKQKLDNIYIDELDLGNIGNWGFYRGDNGRICIKEALKTGNGRSAMHYHWNWNCIKENTNGDVVTTPIFNSESGKIMNALANNSSATLILHDNIDYPAGLEPNYTDRPNRIAAQPKLKIIIEKIFTALGYTMGTNELTGKYIYENIYVANSTEVWQIADMLPHLTAVEFVEQLQLLFNCIIVVYDTTVDIFARKNFYAQSQLTAAHSQTLENVVDAYEVDVDTEGSVSDADKSKIYDISYGDFRTWFLGHNFDNVKNVAAADLTATANPNVFATNYRGHKVSSPYLDGSDVKGNEIDRLQPSPSESTDESTLKLIPMANYKEHYAGYWGPVSNLTRRHLKIFAPQSVGRLIDDDDTTIQQLLDDNAVPKERKTIDRLCLGFLCGCHQVSQPDNQTPDSEIEYDYEMLQSIEQGGVTITNPNYKQSGADYFWEKRWIIDHQDYCMSLFPLHTKTGSGYVENLYKEFYTDSSVIDTAVLYALRFVVNGLLDALQPFLIKNQNFACKQIKYTITAKGFDKIAEGEFYKL